MSPNHIYLINRFSGAGRTQDYALFSEVPKVARNSSNVSVYSNIFQSTTLAREESWNLGINNTYYAWCGTSDEKLSKSAKIELSSAKLASLGTIPASGSSFSVSNAQGRPIIKSKITLTGDAGCFAIETGSDIQADSNVVIGVGAIDADGLLRPLATLAATSGTVSNIAPGKKFFIAAHSSSAGAIIDAADVACQAAVVDFAGHDSRYGAVVTHEENGSFSVKYATQEGFTQAIVIASARKAVAKATSLPDARDLELKALKKQIHQMQLQLEAALKPEDLVQIQKSFQPTMTPAMATSAATADPNTPIKALEPFPVINSGPPMSSVTRDPYPVKPISTWYKATLPFRNAPGQSRRRDIRDRLSAHMQTLGYTYEGGSIDNVLVAMFSHNAGFYGNWHSVEKASQDWSNAAQNLPKHLKGFMVFAEDFKVTRVPEAKGLWRARGETESRASSIPASPELPTLANGGATRRSQSPAKNSRSSTPTSVPNKVLVNGVNGTHVQQASNTPTKASTNGINGNHGRNASGVKPLINGVHINGVKSVSRKYDYPRAEETVMEAAKRRARAILLAEGLSEFASGWQVGGH